MRPPALTRTVGSLGAATLLLCSTTVVSHTFGRATYGLLLPAIEDDLGLSHSRAGLGGTAIYAAYVLGVTLVALVGARVEPLALMKVGLGIAVGGLVVLTIAPTPAALLVGLALVGGAGAPIWLTAPVLSTAGVAPERRGLVIGLLSSAMGASGVVIGVGTRALRGAAGNDDLWRPVWGFEAIWTALVLVGVVAVVRLERTEPVAGGFSIDLVRRTIPSWLRVTLAYALFGGISAGFGSFMVASLEEDGGLSRSASTVVFAAMGLVAIVGAPMMGSLSDRVGRRRLLLFTMSAVVAACLVVGLGSGLVVAVGVLLYGSVAGSYPALIAAYVRDHVEARAFSQVFATITILFTLCALVLPVTVGQLADRTGSFTASYLLLAALGGIAAVLIVGLPVDRPD